MEYMVMKPSVGGGSSAPAVVGYTKIRTMTTTSLQTVIILDGFAYDDVYCTVEHAYFNTQYQDSVLVVNVNDMEGTARWKGSVMSNQSDGTQPYNGGFNNYNSTGLFVAKNTNTHFYSNFRFWMMKPPTSYGTDTVIKNTSSICYSFESVDYGPNRSTHFQGMAVPSSGQTTTSLAISYPLFSNNKINKISIKSAIANCILIGTIINIYGRNYE